MGLPIQRYFSLLAGAGMLAAFTAAAANPGHALTMRGPGPLPLNITQQTCLARNVAERQGPVQHYLSGLYEEVAMAPTGRGVLREQVQLCLDPALDKIQNCDVIYFGKYHNNVVRLNPAQRVGDVTRVLFTVHEARHGVQEEFGITPFANGNIPEEERVAMYWLAEADSRLATLLFAWERSQQGNYKYLDWVRNNVDHAPMLKAFEKSLERQPGSMQAAMQAGFLGFLQAKTLARSYANEIADWVEKDGRSFDPARRHDTLFNEQNLAAMGQFGSYGLYLTPEVIRTLKDSFTTADYRVLTDLRRRAGGSKGDACKAAPTQPG